MEKVSTTTTTTTTARETKTGVDGASSSSSTDDISVVVETSETIEKVPPLFRKNVKNTGLYDPKMVSIGPYHHGKPELQVVQNLKPVVANMFVLGDNDEFYKKVLSMVDDIRRYYVVDESSTTTTYSDEEFAKMMFLDACFILVLIEYMNKCMKREKDRGPFDDIIDGLGSYSLNLLLNDIFVVLENQIPFKVLRLLLRLKFKDDDQGMKMIHSVSDSFLSGEIEDQAQSNEKEMRELADPLHLLALIRKKMLSGGSRGDDDEINQQSERSQKTEKFLSKKNVKEFIYSFRSVSELKAKGIHVRPAKTPCRMDITFKSRYFFFGQLELPVFVSSEDDRQFLSNLIAYELSPHSQTHLTVTAYVNFLKSLINHPDDVKELRSKRVLLGFLDSDEEVVELYNNISTYMVEDFFIYDEVKERIQGHYNSKVKIWMAELIHKYFSGPWTFIAFLAAAFGIALTFAQTYLALFPPSGK